MNISFELISRVRYRFLFSSLCVLSELRVIVKIDKRNGKFVVLRISHFFRIVFRFVVGRYELLKSVICDIFLIFSS